MMQGQSTCPPCARLSREKERGGRGRRDRGTEGRRKGRRSESFGDNQDKSPGDCPKCLSHQHPMWKLRGPPPTSLEMRPLQAAGLNWGCTRACQPVLCLPGFTFILNVLAVHGVLGADLGVVLGRQVQVSKSLKTHSVRQGIQFCGLNSHQMF